MEMGARPGRVAVPVYKRPAGERLGGAGARRRVSVPDDAKGRLGCTKCPRSCANMFCGSGGRARGRCARQVFMSDTYPNARTYASSVPVCHHWVQGLPCEVGPGRDR
eukprot:5892777-Alexandrium_andersonii.AAC.1